MGLEELNIDLNPIEPPNEFDPVMARVKKLAAIAGFIGGAIGLCLSLGAWLLTERPVSRGQIAMPFFCAFILSGMVTGVALLYAPASFFNSATGRQYMKSIGTHHVRSTKIVICVALLVGCGLCILLAMAFMQLIGKIS